MNGAPPLTLPFDEIRRSDLAIVGGKGANLGELAYAGFPVPPGFCLTTEAFRLFIAAAPDPDALYARLAEVAPDDVEAAREAGRFVREVLLEVPLPPGVAEAIEAQWRALGSGSAYAVRSSATAEDLPEASFAGQQDSFLNVIGLGNLLDAVRRCWVSLFTDRAILYRARNGYPHEDVQLSVVVQEMVMAEVSGLLFTADPVTGHRHTAAIDASPGLGEALVGGLVTPDSYRVDKRTLKVIERSIADKRAAVFPRADGGTRRAVLEGEERSAPALSDERILELAEMGVRVEAHYGAPQDIEWAVAGGQVFLLQSRPITSLYPIDGVRSPDGSLRIFFSAGHQQMMTNAMAPLSLSSIKVLLPLGHPEDRIESVFVRSSGGRVYVDVSPALRHPILRHVIFGMLSQFNALAPQALRAAMQRPEFRRPHGVSFSLSLLRGLARMARRVFAALWREDLTGSAERVDARVSQQVAAVRAMLRRAPPVRALVQAMIDVMRPLLHVVLEWAPVFIAAEIARRAMLRVARGWADPADLEAYSLGLPGNVVTEMNLALGDLAEIARRSPDIAALFADLGAGSRAWLARAKLVDGSGPFFEAWESFLEKYGARGPSEIDIRTPRWVEEPLPLLQVIAASLQNEAGSHRRQHAKLAAARERAVTRLLEGAAHGALGKPRVRLVRRLIHVVHHGSVLREHHKFMMVQIILAVKERLKELGSELVEAGLLAHPDDLWFLTWPEMLELGEAEAGELAARSTERRARLAEYEKLTPPMIITSDGESPVVRYEVADAPPGALTGNPVSPGIVEGKVRVVRDPAVEVLQPGEILVAQFTDPGWTPLFINAGGLVLEVGGAMTHGSVVAREYGIPAVVGVREATQLLHTGQRVRVDGSRGVVENLSDEPRFES